jgi:hypothetical protein
MRLPHLVTNQGFDRSVLLRRSALLCAIVCMPTQGIGQATFDSLIACTRLTADTERLACFDRAMTEMRKISPRQPPTQLRAHIVSVSRSATDRQVFVLDNAQTWQQIELDPEFTVRTGQEVTISKGALGSFWLAIDSHRATRVQRIQSSKSG